MTDLPASPVPPDCDLRGLPFMPLDVVRLMDSDLFALSTGDEFKAAVALWCKSWLQVPAASLPDDPRVLAHLSGAGARWKKVAAMALRGWVKCSDGRLYHPVVAEKAAEAWRHRLAQRARAAKRWGAADATPPASAVPPDKPRPSSGNATASPVAHATAMQGTGTGTDSASLRSAAPAEAVAPGKPLEDLKAPDPPKPQPPADFDLEHDMPSGLRRAPPPKPTDRIWGPLREALGLGDADRSFIGKLIRDHGEEAVCGAMALAAKAPPADPKSWLKANLKGGRNGQAEQAQRGNDDSLLARTKALLAERDARLGAGDPNRAADAVLPAVQGRR